MFPASEFDDWASTYDHDVLAYSFPFDGYENVLDAAFALAEAKSGMSVLDLGIGTGNLTARFAAIGCQAWGVDFSPAMLAAAQRKLPQARLFQTDLLAEWPAALERRFDRIVSAYTFHHFPLADKVRLVSRLAIRHLTPGGWLVIADIAFPTQAALEAVKQSAGEDWDDEIYWVAAEAVPAMQAAGLNVDFCMVSSCAGVFKLW